MLALAPDAPVLLERAGRPRGIRPPCRAAARDAARGPAVLRHLLRQPAARPRPRLRHLQAAVRPPRHQPARARQGHRPGRDHLAQPRLRRRRADRPRQRVDRGLRPGRGRATTTSTTTSSRASTASTSRRSRCSTTPSRPPARTTPTTCSTASATWSSRARRPAPDAQARRHHQRPRHRLRSDRHRPGGRVRLLGHPGLPRAA